MNVSVAPAALELNTERLGPLPLINCFIERLQLEALLERFVPSEDRRIRLANAKALGVLVRTVLVEREPMYRQQETVAAFASQAFGLSAAQVPHLRDDALGRALDRLFDADRSALLTETVLASAEQFDLRLDELHNDSTTIRFCGQYRQARGGPLRGKASAKITHGYSKDHRPDLKQLLFIMTTTDDGGVPVQFRCEAGNATDARSHRASWEALQRVAGRADFLYVADSKLCSREAMDHIDHRGGRFVCVMPRNRLEDTEFREWIQTHEPAWALARNEPNPRRAGGPRDRWWVWRASRPSREGWPVIWIHSALLALRQEHQRRERLATAEEKLSALNERLGQPRARRRKRDEIDRLIDEILSHNRVSRYLNVSVHRAEDHRYQQTTRGRPGPDTRYVRKTRTYWQLNWTFDEHAIAYDRNSDGMYPLLTNDRTLTDTQVFEAHKRQPTIEKRFEQTKTVFEIAPVFLKNEGRVEALFYVYFLSLLIQSLIERELRLAMHREGIAELPLYPEERMTKRPTAEQVFRLFSHAQRHTLLHQDKIIRVFETQLTEMQRTVLSLLKIPPHVFSFG